MKLTREEALKLHKQMWGNMKKKYGDYPSHRERHDFKEHFITKYFGEDEDFENDCFLCEYALHKGEKCYMQKADDAAKLFSIQKQPQVRSVE